MRPLSADEDPVTRRPVRASISEGRYEWVDGGEGREAVEARPALSGVGVCLRVRDHPPAVHRI